MSFHRFKWFSNASLRKTILCSYSLPFCSDPHSRVLYFPSHIVYSIHRFLCARFSLWFFSWKIRSGKSFYSIFVSEKRRRYGQRERESERKKKNKMKKKLPKRNRYQELFNAIVCIVCSCFDHCDGKICNIVFFLLAYTVENGTEKENLGKNIIKYYILFVYMWECITI